MPSFKSRTRREPRLRSDRYLWSSLWRNPSRRRSKCPSSRLPRKQRRCPRMPHRRKSPRQFRWSNKHHLWRPAPEKPRRSLFKKWTFQQHLQPRLKNAIATRTRLLRSRRLRSRSRKRQRLPQLHRKDVDRYGMGMTTIGQWSSETSYTFFLMRANQNCSVISSIYSQIFNSNQIKK